MLRRLLPLLPLLALLSCKNKDEDKEPVDKTEPIPDPAELMVGVAKVTMPVPVGIGTIGFGSFGVDAEPSPFNDVLASTDKQWGQNDFRAVVISRGGPHEVVFLRLDMMNVFQAQRDYLIVELEERLGRNIDANLLITATHTHAGPGRMVPAEGGPLELGFGRFHTEFFDRMIDAMADAVEAAYADLKPGRVGHAIANVGAAVEDRRCEDGAEGTEAADDTTPIIVVEQEGKTRAIVASMGYHGTLLDVDSLTLSPDVSGPVERAIEDRFDHAVQVQLHNSWGGDHRPGNPPVDTQDGYAMPGGFDQGEAVGQQVADAVEAVLGDVEMLDEPTVWAEVHRVPLGREAMGYAEDEFLYEYGGVYCDLSDEGDCDLSTDFFPLFDDFCLPLIEEYAEFGILQTTFTTGRVGDLHIVTMPGEPANDVAVKIMDGIRANHDDVEDVMFFGYANDYNGYSLLEDNWWQGGYEATGAMWGPKQGSYLSDRVIEAFGHYKAGTVEDDSKEAIEPPPLATADFTPYKAATGRNLGSVLTDVAGPYTTTDLVEVTVAGNDPWLGTPIAYLEDDKGKPITRDNGEPISSLDFGFWWVLTTDPTYKDDLDTKSREFQWNLKMPVSHRTVGAWPTLSGDYRIRVVFPQSGGEEATTSVFTVQ